MQIFLSEVVLQSNRAYDVIDANIDYVNRMLGCLYKPEELPLQSLQSYYVDYYLQQVRNGGISQFIYNSRWNPVVVQYVESGLEAMNAPLHFALFQQVSMSVERLGDELEEFLAGNYFGDGEASLRNSLNEQNDIFSQTAEQEDLAELNASFLKNSSLVRSVSSGEYENAVTALCEQVPNREERRKEAKLFAAENEPEEHDVIRRLCELAQKEFVQVNAISFGQHEGQPVLEWHISTTDAAACYVVFTQNKAFLFDGTNKPAVAECDIERD